MFYSANSSKEQLLKFASHNYIDQICLTDVQQCVPMYPGAQP